MAGAVCDTHAWRHGGVGISSFVMEPTTAGDITGDWAVVAEIKSAFVCDEWTGSCDRDGLEFGEESSLFAHVMADGYTVVAALEAKGDSGWRVSA